MLQCVAAFLAMQFSVGVLQSVAELCRVFCSVLQNVAGCCRVLQGVAVCCSVSQSVAVSDSLV